MKTLKILALTAAIVLAFLDGVHAQAVARLEADTIALGDQTTLTIRRALTYPSIDALSTNGIVALSQDFDSTTHTLSTVITSFEPGEHYIRLSPNDSLLLVVNDVVLDSTSIEPRDLAPLERIPYTFWEIFRWVLLALAVAAIGIGAWWLVKRRRTYGSLLFHHEEPKDTRTPEERALDRLEELRRSQLWQQGKAKEYHTELTDSLRIFVEESTGIRATELTSAETIESIEGLKAAVDCGPLREIFNTADLVKFAKSEPQPHEHDRSMALAVDFVKAMWQAVKPAEEEVAHE